jgi:ABC-type transporter Mla subunit MlaD
MKNRNLSDWAVALSVIACSVILFAALALALSGTMLGKPARTLLVNFPDVTGINLGGQVKYGGAAAGRISAIRILSPEERLASGDPRNTVQVTLALTKVVPPLPTDITVTVAADTLLSDKFLLLSGGTPGGAVLDDGAVLQGIPPVSIDQLSRNLDATLNGLRGLVGGGDKADDLFKRVSGLLDITESLLGDTRDLIGSARPVLTDAQALVTQTKGVVNEAGELFNAADVVIADAGALISENRQPIKRTFARLEVAAGTFDQLATRGNTFFANNEKKISDLLSDFRVTGQNLKVTSTYAEILTRVLAQQPSKLIWGGRANSVPTREQILKGTPTGR